MARTLPGRGALRPFVNQNHFAGFVGLTDPLDLAMLFSDAVRRDKMPLLSLVTVLPIGVLIVSGPRGSAVFCSNLCGWHSHDEAQRIAEFVRQFFHLGNYLLN